MTATLTQGAFSEKFRGMHSFAQTEEIAALQEMVEEIRELKREKNAVILSHFYMSPELQVHHNCGDVKTDLHGQTSIDRLYAIGEVACTGIHGANRLASNSLLEGVMFARKAAALGARYSQPDR